MTIDLTELFKVQNVLKERIGYKEPDHFDKLKLALLVEVGECANEWRGFKFWSKKEPVKFIHTTAGATPENAVMFKCMEEDNCGEYLQKEDFESLFDPNYEECPKCHVGYVNAFRRKYPLLEEYVDGLHFVMELGLVIHSDFRVPYKRHRFDNHSVTNKFNAVYYMVANLEEGDSLLNDKEYRILLTEYVELADDLGFTWDQVENAYYEKNAINHQRQESGY
jgi:dimeric dUTPase (all-alpha-NTP-PPase superfamily)